MTKTYDPRFVGGPTHTRTAVNRAVDWISGEYPSGKPAMDFRMVRWDGTPSRAFIVVLEGDKAVISYREKPAPFRWTDGLRWRTYTPDFAVDLADGRKIGVEVMPMRRVVKTGFLRRLPHIRRAALGNGYSDFELWTENEIEQQPRLANEALIASERTFVSDEGEEHRMRLAIRELGGRASVSQLRRASGLESRSFRAVVRLVALGELRATRPDLPLDDYAVVEIPNR